MFGILNIPKYKTFIKVLIYGEIKKAKYLKKVNDQEKYASEFTARTV